jgi:hypothetical protein
MAIYANDIVQDALALVDIVSPGEAGDPWFSLLAVRLLNGLLSEWALKGLYNPLQTYAQFDANGNGTYTVGTDDSLVKLSNTKYTVVGTVDVNGTYYQSTSNNGQTVKYSVQGTGTKYSLVVNEDTNGTFYAIAGGYSQQLVGDFPTNFVSISRLQCDIGQVTYSPRVITMAEYQALSVKNINAPPTVWAWDYQQPISTLYIWPRPLTHMTIRLIGSPSIPMVANTQSNIQLDQMYYIPLLYNLATKLYPYLKRDNGIDPEIIYQARSSMAALRSRVMAMKSRHVNVPFGNKNGVQDYWTSSLNTVTGNN